MYRKPSAWRSAPLMASSSASHVFSLLSCSSFGRSSLASLVALGPVPTVISKGPRTYQSILLCCCEIENLGNANEKIHRYLTVFPYDDLLKEQRIVFDTPC